MSASPACLAERRWPYTSHHILVLTNYFLNWHPTIQASNHLAAEHELCNHNIWIISLSIIPHGSCEPVVEQPSKVMWCWRTFRWRLTPAGAHHRHLSSSHTALWSVKWSFRQHFSHLPLGTADASVQNCVCRQRCIKWETDWSHRMCEFAITLFSSPFYVQSKYMSQEKLVLWQLCCLFIHTWTVWVQHLLLIKLQTCNLILWSDIDC